MSRAFWLQTANQNACEIAAIAGFDMVVFDAEHGVFDTAALDRLVPFCNAIGLKSMVRVGDANRYSIQSALDMGADGVILPQVRDLEHATQVSALAKFPPLGSRGIGFSRTTQYDGATSDFIARENSGRPCYVMIETPGALNEAGEIAKLPCVDGLFIGPGDLSLGRGRGVFQSSEADFADLQTVAKAAKAGGKQFAAAGATVEYARQASSYEASFVVEGDELTAMMIGFKSLLGGK